MVIYPKFRSPTHHTDYPVPWPSGHGSPPSEPQSPQPNLHSQRRMPIASSPSLAFVAVDPSQNNHGVPRRSSAPHIDSKDLPSDKRPSADLSPPNPSKPTLTLKLYPWITLQESPPPPRGTCTIKCPYPTNGCVEALPKNLVIWRRHLINKHGLSNDGVVQTCQWPRCGMTMGGRSLNRHVLMKHMDFKPTCPHCKVRRRYDHLDKHILNCPSHPARVGG